jgi:DNA-binding FadR family transcriptional regulator
MSKTDEAVHELLEMIRSGRFSGGDQLPTEPELVAQVGVSRGAVREAVQSLCFAGVLRVRQGGGTYVTDLAPSRVLRSATLAFSLAGDEVLAELYAVRRILEPAAAAMAASRLTDAQLVELEAQLDAMRVATAPEAFVGADVAFHDLVAAAAGNATLRALLRTLRSESSPTLTRRAEEDEESQARAVADHEAILSALRAHDAELARAATTLHLAAGQRWLEAAPR